MIGVYSNAGDKNAVREFFELFKTPWEFCQPGRRYDVIIANTADLPVEFATGALIIYSAESTQRDHALGIDVCGTSAAGWVEWQGGEFPVYGKLARLSGSGKPVASLRDSLDAVGVKSDSCSCRAARFGFDLFDEVRFLLGKGQPPENSQTPTLDRQIALLRSALIELEVAFVEVPPVPAGFDFMVCLTHDVDFIGIRDHKFDHTMWGFLYRCFAGSFFDALRGRLSWKKCFRNWTAGISLPLVHLGLVEDFWLEFDRYREIEKGLGSTFFFIPFPNRPGIGPSGTAPSRRAAKYDVAENNGHIEKLIENECEIGIHGIDAWSGAEKGRVELHRIREVAGDREFGIRMHWLYWADDSPKALEDAGFVYDSTFGYNEAVGFRAGTAQAFRPLIAQDLLELPLNIQDSALFYPNRMNVSETDAMVACERVIESVSAGGGALIINWHTRSLSPERQWGDFYVQLIGEIQKRSAWFGTAHSVNQWFRKRRELRFAEVQFTDDGVRVELAGVEEDRRFSVRVYDPRFAGPNAAAPVYQELIWSRENVFELCFSPVTCP